VKSESMCGGFTSLFVHEKFDRLGAAPFGFQGCGLWSQLDLKFQPQDRNPPRIVSGVFEVNINAGPIRTKRKSLRPFDYDDGFLSEYIFEPERFQISEIFNAIEIDVIDLAVIVEYVD